MTIYQIKVAGIAAQTFSVTSDDVEGFTGSGPVEISDVKDYAKSAIDFDFEVIEVADSDGTLEVYDEPLEVIESI